MRIQQGRPSGLRKKTQTVSSQIGDKLPGENPISKRMQTGVRQKNDDSAVISQVQQGVKIRSSSPPASYSSTPRNVICGRPGSSPRTAQLPLILKKKRATKHR